jgi:iron complex outermembrane receptor protein
VRLNVLLAAAGVFAPVTTLAQEVEGAFTVGEVIVTAPRAARPGAEQVLTREDLDRLNLDRLTEALERTPGLTLTPGARGGPRAETRVFIRGFDAAQTVLSLDGVPFYAPFDGEPTDLARFTTFDLAAIEVVKGFGSALDGPNALGGRVNLVSRRPDEPLQGELRGAVDFDGEGSSSGGRASLQGGAVRGRGYLQGGVSFIERDQWRLPDEFRPDGPRSLGGGGLSAGFLEDGGRRNRSEARDLQLNGKLGFRPRPGDELAVFGWRQESQRGVPPYAGPPVRGQTFNFFDWPRWDRAGVAGAADLGVGSIRLSARAYVDTFRNRLLGFDDDRYATQALRVGRVFDTPYDDRAVGGSLKLSSAPWAGARLGWAAHLRRDRHAETPNTLSGRQTPTYRFEDLTSSLGVELDQAIAPGLSLSLGAARHARKAEAAPDQQRSGASFPLTEAEAIDGQAGLSWRPGEGGVWFVGAARKSRFATQFERYSYRLGAALPNPELGAERATHWQLGWRGSLGEARLETALFRIDIEDAIQRTTRPPRA